MRFWKTQSIGNDFVLVTAADAAGYELAPLAVAACDRRFGIGSDGLLVVASHPDGIDLRMFNPDGSEDFCGNGMRCAARFAFDQRWVGREFTIRHGGTDVRAAVHADGSVTVETPPASFRPLDIPTRAAGEMVDVTVAGIPVTVLSTGSAHAVTFVDELPQDAAFLQVSPAVEHAEPFPERVSLMWVLPEADGSLRLRIWERGVGETMGCGTGSVAAAVAWARRTGRAGRIVVHNPGGPLIAEFDDWRGAVRATTRPETVFHGEFAPAELGLSLRESVASPPVSPR